MRNKRRQRARPAAAPRAAAHPGAAPARAGHPPPRGTAGPLRRAALAGVLCALPAMLCAEGRTALNAPAPGRDPLSAIDWLDLPGPAGGTATLRPPIPDEPPATPDARVPDVAVMPLEAVSPAGVGLLPGHVSGLPPTLWQTTSAETARRALDALPTQAALPAAQNLSLTLLLAEAPPPRGDADTFLAARLDALIRRGALAPARELIALLPPQPSARIVARAAEIALLEGDIDAVCGDILARPALRIDPSLRVFCAARSGAWAQAVTLLETARALGDIPDGRYFRLLRFLDPDLAETLPELPQPTASALDALDFRLLVATGAPMPTATLPLPFAVAEVSGDSGWKPRIEAAERLVRAGAVAETRLFAAYLHRRPAASGGVWDRVAAFQRLDAALGDGDPVRVGAALRRAWPLFQAHDLAVPLAREIGPRLAGLALPPAAMEAAGAAMLLSPEYERLARGLAETGPEMRFAASVAAGRPEAPPDAQARAIAAAWDDWDAATPRPPAPEAGQLGMALLETLRALEAGADGNLRALTAALRQLRALGLEDVARRAALQLRLAAPPA